MLQKVYQLCSQIPSGKVSTYKLIALAAYGSPNYARWVGTLLSKCPDCKSISNSRNYDCPRIHCYRVIKSDFRVGGLHSLLGGTSQAREKIKSEILANERVFFDKKGYLLKDLREKVIFKKFHVK